VDIVALKHAVVMFFFCYLTTHVTAALFMPVRHPTLADVDVTCIKNLVNSSPVFKILVTCISVTEQ